MRINRQTVLTGGASVLCAIIVLLLVVFGRGLFELDQDGVTSFLAGVQQSPWSFVAVALLYTGLALVGFPQALLYAGTVGVFGGALGAFYSLAATMVSSVVTFYLGKFVGGFWVTKISEGRAQTLIRVMRDRGLVATMVVRWLPTAPMVVVNSICGASGMALWKFIIGTSLGTIPKIALIAFFTEQVDDMLRFITSGDTSALVAIAAIVVAWIAFMVFCRWLYVRLRTTSLSALTAEPTAVSTSTDESEHGNADINSKSKAQCEGAS